MAGSNNLTRNGGKQVEFNDENEGNKMKIRQGSSSRR
jgi:hypothetical protein